MPKFVDLVTGLIHGTAGALVDHQIAPKVGTAISDLVTSSFGIANEVLTIVRDVTAPPVAQPQSQPPPPQ